MLSHDPQKSISILLQYVPSVYIVPSSGPSPGGLVGTRSPDEAGTEGTVGGGGVGGTAFGVACSISGGVVLVLGSAMAGATGITGSELMAGATWLDGRLGSSIVYPSLKVGWTSGAWGDSGDNTSLLGVGTPREVFVSDLPNSRVGREAIEGLGAFAKPETPAIDVWARPGTKTPAALGSWWKPWGLKIDGDPSLMGWKMTPMAHLFLLIEVRFPCKTEAPLSLRVCSRGPVDVFKTLSKPWTSLNSRPFGTSWTRFYL